MIVGLFVLIPIHVAVLAPYTEARVGKIFVLEPDLIAVPIKQCTADNQCVDYQRCLGGRCVGACDVDKYSYATNAICHAIDHTANWTCPSGYDGEPLETCTKECTVNTDCATTDLCVENVCIPGCHTLGRGCHYHGVCYPGIHNPRCVYHDWERGQKHKEHMEDLERRGKMNIGIVTYLKNHPQTSRY